jgi:hypothetical protein
MISVGHSHIMLMISHKSDSGYVTAETPHGNFYLSKKKELKLPFFHLRSDENMDVETHVTV